MNILYIVDIPDSSTSYSNYAVTNLYDRDYSTDFCTQDDVSKFQYPVSRSS